MRESQNITRPINWSKAKKTLEEIGTNFSVFGGEPLLTPIAHLEEVWAFGLERFGLNGIQTNGTLITEKHIELFEKYKVQVGISFDGPGELNGYRLGTEKTYQAIKTLCERKIIPSLIITIHSRNAKKPELKAFLDEFTSWGGTYINLHMLEHEGCHNSLMTEKDNIEAFLDLYEYSKTSPLYMVPFIEIKKLFTERYPQVNCIWNGCDPQSTSAVQGVTPDGTMSNCGRTNKDGVNWLKASEYGGERYRILALTPQENGGCKDCKYFTYCKGNCPGTAIGGDWRNRTEHCRTWYALFSAIEKDLISEGRTILTSDAPKPNSHSDSPHIDYHEDWHMDNETKLLNT